MDATTLRKLAEAATVGKWEWLIHDHSTASLGVGNNPGMGDPLVLSVSPCRACVDNADPKEWRWGRCCTPSEADAAYITAANPTAIIALLDHVAELEGALRWRPMTEEPRDGCFRLYGLHVQNRSGFRWFEVHYVALDDTGQMVEPSGDSFSAWSYDDFEVWADAPEPPPRAALGGSQ